MTLIPRFLQASALESQKDGVDAESSNTANPPGGNPPGNSTSITALPVTVPDNTPGLQHRTLALTDRRGFSNDVCLAIIGTLQDAVETQNDGNFCNLKERLWRRQAFMASGCTATAALTILATSGWPTTVMKWNSRIPSSISVVALFIVLGTYFVAHDPLSCI
ncbi:hypothetical protein BD769DRAFT_386449 [Suillus cothurnatus]|nr:hypothetical protein BD769DRAFT_386449 [Suillus cothurnatus]